MSVPTVSVSAHRRDTDDEPTALARALATGAEYVELDVRRTADGRVVVRHDPLGSGPYYLLEDALKVLAGRARAHLDLKEEGYEREILDLATAVTGDGGFVVTTKSAASIRAVKALSPATICALSVGRSPWDRGFPQDLFPVARVRACGADWAALNHRLAPLGVLARCARAGVPVMLWTVNDTRLIRRYVHDPRVAVLITDRPADALRLRLP